MAFVFRLAAFALTFVQLSGCELFDSSASGSASWQDAAVVEVLQIDEQ